MKKILILSLLVLSISLGAQTVPSGATWKLLTSGNNPNGSGSLVLQYPKMVDYKLIIYADDQLKTIETEVKTLLRAGWTPLGAPFRSSGEARGWVCQAMVKYQ